MYLGNLVNNATELSAYLQSRADGGFPLPDEIILSKTAYSNCLTCVELAASMDYQGHYVLNCFGHVIKVCREQPKDPFDGETIEIMEGGSRITYLALVKLEVSGLTITCHIRDLSNNRRFTAEVISISKSYKHTEIYIINRKEL